MTRIQIAEMMEDILECVDVEVFGLDRVDMDYDLDKVEGIVLRHLGGREPE
jgi:hypothetical protein